MSAPKCITATGRASDWSPIEEAEFFGNLYLGDANELAEAGKSERAERLYAKGQWWLDRYNRLAGNS